MCLPNNTFYQSLVLQRTNTFFSMIERSPSTLNGNDNPCQLKVLALGRVGWSLEGRAAEKHPKGALAIRPMTIQSMPSLRRMIREWVAWVMVLLCGGRWFWDYSAGWHWSKPKRGRCLKSGAVVGNVVARFEIGIYFCLR